MVDLNVDHIITTGLIQNANRGVAGSSPAESFNVLSVCVAQLAERRIYTAKA